jgi:membrane peptidoglycan carboxypeptidase
VTHDGPSHDGWYDRPRPDAGHHGAGAAWGDRGIPPGTYHQRPERRDDRPARPERGEQPGRRPGAGRADRPEAAGWQSGPPPRPNDRPPHDGGPYRYGPGYDDDPTEQLRDPYGPYRSEPTQGYGGEADAGQLAAARRALRGGPGGPGGPGEPPDGSGPAGPGGPTGPGDKKRRRRKIRRIVLSTVAALMVIFVGLAITLYVGATVPTPNQLATSQISTITFSDGLLMAKAGAQNRTDVKLAQVPEHVRWAVIAAENRTFYSDPGISAKGVLRAAWNNVHGGELQGGSGITQQYVKNAFLTQQKTLSRKTKELAIAIKVDRQYSKDQILEWYLNTIYFGRGAYGIEAAAETYFGKTVDKLSVAEGAVLASSIRSPALYDPQNHPEAAKSRWQFVIDGMVGMGKLAPATAAQTHYPTVRPRGSSGQPQLNGPIGLVVQQVKDELARNGFDEAALNVRGLKVVTTIDHNAQAAAVSAVKTVFADQPRALRNALVAVDPTSGKVLAYYGGPNGNGFDYAQAWRPPGSSFKPLTLATALQQTVHQTNDAATDPVSVYKTYDGSSPRTFNGVSVRNSSNAQCPRCTVLEAMKRSINTVFYDMAIQVGPDNVAELAHKLGVPVKQTNNGTLTLQKDGVTDGSIGIGRYEVRPIDQAVSFGVFAAGGQLHQPYFVQKVLDNAGHVLYEHKDSHKQVLDPKVANDVTYAMKPVAKWSHDELAGARESASKTGTQQFGETDDNSDAWMVGFTPTISAAVWVGQDRPGPIRNSRHRAIYGSGLPGLTWRAFMNAYLSGKPQQALTDSVQINPQLRTTTAPSSAAPPVTTTAPPRRTTPPPAHTTTAPPPVITHTPTATATPTPTPTPTPTETPPLGPSGLPPTPTRPGGSGG